MIAKHNQTKPNIAKLIQTYFAKRSHKSHQSNTSQPNQPYQVKLSQTLPTLAIQFKRIYQNLLKLIFH